jgi:hypothetical protein
MRSSMKHQPHVSPGSSERMTDARHEMLGRVFVFGVAAPTGTEQAQMHP